MEQYRLLDFDKIWTNLYQGSFPPAGDTLASKGFNVLVLCADEHQNASLYPGVKVILAPGDDDIRIERLVKHSLDTWLSAADEIAQHITTGDKVLVTCMAGMNRSGFVVAVVLNKLFGWSGAKCVQHVRQRRAYALSNKTFSTWLLDNLKQKEKE